MPFVEIPKHTDIVGLKDNQTFKLLMERAIKLTGEIDDRIEELALIKEELELEHAQSGAEGSVSYKGWRLSVVDKAGTKRIDRGLLLKLLGPDGVQIMKKATVEGKPSHYIQLVRPKEGESNGEKD